MQQQESIQEILAYYGSLADKSRQETVVSLLRELQEVNGYLTPELKQQAAAAAGVPQSLIQAIIGRFSSLKEAPYRHEIILCSGARCGAKGGHGLIEAVQKALGMDGPGLSPDGLVFVKVRNCLKQCRTSPNLYVDGQLYTHVAASQIPEILVNCKCKLDTRTIEIS